MTVTPVEALTALSANALTANDALYDLAVAMERPDNPAVEARQIVRDGLRDVRIWIGETTADAEDYQPRHAEKEPQS